MLEISLALSLSRIIYKETWIASAMIIASSADRAMTVREWDPVLQGSAWGYGPCRAPLP